MAALQGAGKRWVEQAKERFVKDPPPGNVRTLLEDAASAAIVGYDYTAAVSDVIDAGAERLRENAEQADRLCIRWGKKPLEPRAIPPVPAGTVHVVGPGETLSRISQRYFGSPGYRDVIYRKNRDIIRDPKAVAAGTRLKIS